MLNCQRGKKCLAGTSRAFRFPFCSVTPSKQSHEPCRAGTHRLSLPLRQGVDDTRVTGNLYCFVQDLALAIPNRLLFLSFFFWGGKTVISTSSILRIPNFQRTWESSRHWMSQVDALVHGFAGYFHCELYAGASAWSHDGFGQSSVPHGARIKCVHQSGELL